MVKTRLASPASSKAQFCVLRANRLSRCERILKLWKISAILIVKKAIVMPSFDCSDAQEPPSIM